MIDIHAHVLPGIDDGAETVQETVEMCRLAFDDGIDTIVATPHMNTGRYNTSKEVVLGLVDEVNRILKQEGIKLTVLPGADVRVDGELSEKIEDGRVVTVNNKRSHIMVEFPDYSLLPEIDRWVFQLQLKGITPIFTHPERNHVVRGNLQILYRWVELGGLLQITSYSLLGFFGKDVRRFSEDLVRRGLVHLVGSDAHSPKMPPFLSDAYHLTSKLVGLECADRIFHEYPEAIVHGKKVFPDRPIQRPQSFFRRAFGSVW